MEKFQQVPFTTCDNLKVWLKYFFLIEQNNDCDSIMNIFIDQLKNIHLDRENNVLPFSIFKNLSNHKIMTIDYFNATRLTLHKQYINFDGTAQERQSVFDRVAQEYCNKILEWVPIQNNEIENISTQLKRMALFWFHITDIYLFFRIFRNWNTEKEWRSVEGCKGNNYNIKNIVAYTGANHSEILGRLINAAFKEEISQPGKDFLIENPDTDFKLNISKNQLIYPFFQKLLGLPVTFGGKKRKTHRKRKKRKTRKNKRSRRKRKTKNKKKKKKTKRKYKN